MFAWRVVDNGMCFASGLRTHEHPCVDVFRERLRVYDSARIWGDGGCFRLPNLCRVQDVVQTIIVGFRLKIVAPAPLFEIGFVGGAFGHHALANKRIGSVVVGWR